MKTKPSIINEPATTATPRCQHRSLKGTCRQLATGPAGTLCFDHARAEQQAKNDFTLLAPLVRKSEDFQSAEALNETLGALHNLLAEGRISPRRAATIAYVDSLVLRTLPAMAINVSEPDRAGRRVNLRLGKTKKPAETFSKEMLRSLVPETHRTAV